VDPAGLRPLVRIRSGGANPILVAALTHLVSGRPVGRRRILLGSVAYAIPYVAMWSLVGFALGDAVRRA
jgi:hypothetical protein